MNIILLFVVFSVQTCFATLQLQQVNVIFRHGDRTPSLNSQYPTDPDYGNDFYPIGYGGLTNAGKLRTFELGEFLRKRYNQFLGDVYFPNVVDAVSTDLDRTKNSLQIVLAALFPPKDEQKWHNNLNWQPISTTYTPKEQDDLLGSLKIDGFEARAERFNKVMENQIYKYAEFMSELTNLTGKLVNSTIDVKRIYDTLSCKQNMNLTLPEWSKGMYPDGKLLEATLLDFNLLKYDIEFLHFLNGKLLSKLTNDMLTVKNKKGIGARDTKIFLYSAHDTNLIGILQVLHLFKRHVPYFSSAVIVELLKEQDQYYVKVLYYHGNTTQVEELKMPGFSELCPFEKYLTNVDYIVNFKT